MEHRSDEAFAHIYKKFGLVSVFPFRCCAITSLDAESGGLSESMSKRRTSRKRNDRYHTVCKVIHRSCKTLSSLSIDDSFERFTFHRREALQTERLKKASGFFLRNQMPLIGLHEAELRRIANPRNTPCFYFFRITNDFAGTLVGTVALSVGAPLETSMAFI